MLVISFLLGAFVGCGFGVALMCLCITSGKESRKEGKN